jgi:hypothetical protein
MSENIDYEYVYLNRWRVNWEIFSSYSGLSEEMIEEFKYYVKWHCILKYQKLSNSFIEKMVNNFVNRAIYKPKMDMLWECLSVYQNAQHENNLNWILLSENQNLSENFIEKYKDKIDWNCISRCQKLSTKFIEKYKDKVYWKTILYRQKLNDILIINCWEYIEKEVNFRHIGDGLAFNKNIEYTLFQSKLGMSLLIL